MSNDTWATPQALFDALDLEFNFDHDVCAEHSTAKCPTYWTVEDDALVKDWVKDPTFLFSRWLWCNPPYSNPLPFVQKAIGAQLSGIGVVMLMNHDMSVEWSKLLLDYVTEIRVLVASGCKKEKTYENGRLAFIKNGKPVNSNPKGQAVFVFDPHKVGYCMTTYVKKTDLLSKGLAA